MTVMLLFIFGLGGEPVVTEHCAFLGYFLAGVLLVTNFEFLCVDGRLKGCALT